MDMGKDEVALNRKAWPCTGMRGNSKRITVNPRKVRPGESNNKIDFLWHREWSSRGKVRTQMGEQRSVSSAGGEERLRVPRRGNSLFLVPLVKVTDLEHVRNRADVEVH